MKFLLVLAVVGLGACVLAFLARHLPRLAIAAGIAALLLPIPLWRDVLATRPQEGFAALGVFIVYIFAALLTAVVVGYGCLLIGIGWRVLRGEDVFGVTRR